MTPTPDLAILISLAADGKISRRDWQVIDAVHVRREGVRPAARRVGISPPEVLRRMRRIAALCAVRP